MSARGPDWEVGRQRRELREDIAAVRVLLAGRAEAVAARIVERYGAAVEVRVGALPYPMDREEPVRAREPRLPPSLEVEGLEAHIDLDVRTLEPGGTGEGRVVLANRGTDRIELKTTRRLFSWLVDPATGRVVGGFTGRVARRGRGVELAPGQETAIRLLVGTDSLDPGLGYVVPPWTYLVRVLVPVGRGPERPAIRVPDATLEVAAPAP